MTTHNETEFQIDPILAKDTTELKTIGGVPLSLCYAGLMNDKRYPWIILVPKQTGLVDMTDLSQKDQHQLMDEISVVTTMMKQSFNPFKLNIAALGNMVRQLHIHIITRQQQDHAWPNPVWGIGDAEPYKEDELKEMISKLN